MSHEFKVEIGNDASTPGRLVGRITMDMVPTTRKLIEDCIEDYNRANDKSVEGFIAANGPIPDTVFNLLDGMLRALPEDNGPVEISISRMTSFWSFEMVLNDGVATILGEVRAC